MHAHRLAPIMLLTTDKCSKGEYKQSARTSAGADKWLEVKMWEGGTHEALTQVKAAGYQLIVTHLSKGSVTIQVNACQAQSRWCLCCTRLRG